ncbi:MAG: DNA polymerase III subunit delta [Microcella sp.]|nr:DNA polymerase III subunit delta [Microcella sp.]
MAAPKKGSSARAAARIPQVAWHQIRSAPVILVSGPEGFLAERASRQLRDALRDIDASLEVHDLMAESYSAGELLTLASPSLFGEPRLIRVDGASSMNDAFLQEALEYIEAPADDTVLLIRHGGGVRGKKLLDAIRSGVGGGIEVVCAELKRDSDRADFAAAEFRHAGRAIAPAALRALVSAFTDDLAELAGASQQLIADTDGDISEQTVAKYYGGRVEVNAFAVADAAIAGRHGEALRLLRHALATGADPVPMVAAFAMKLRTMAKVGGSSGSGGQVASALGLAPWQVDRARRDLQGWDESGLGRAILAAAETDAAVKGAERDSVYALETLVRTVAARGHGL